jgi:alanine racemase
VALVQEGLELRDAGIDAAILVLSEQPHDQVPEMVAAALIPTVYTRAYADAVAACHVAHADLSSYPVHVKVDTGMQRVGVEPGAAGALIAHIGSLAPALRLAGVYTHLACADAPGSAANAEQLASFVALLGELDRAGVRVPRVHAANSAAALAIPASRFDMVRTGIAIYGISPGAGVDHLVADLRPVMSVRARVAYVKRVTAGSHVSYGWRHTFERDTNLVTVPLGYADGIPRRLGTLPDRPGADVLIGGRRCPIVGVVTMDQLMVDVGGPDGTRTAEVGDEVVLIGRQGDEAVTAEAWAERLGTIGYEVVCGIAARVPRVVRSTD